VTDSQLEPPAVHDVSDTSRPSSSAEVDLDAIERDLHDVETALNRLADGTYWVDEVTGEAISEQTLVRNPMARRA
jgi:RNA polymerase-binding transcription factor DksA